MRDILTKVAILGSLSFACSFAQAQAIFLSFPDSDIVGESVKDNHLGEIDVLAFSWDLTTEPGKKSTTNVAINALKLTKLVDSSTAAILTKAVIGEILGRAVIKIEKPGGCGPGSPSGHVDYLVLTLHDAIVASVSSSASGGDDRIVEQIVFDFSSINGVYTACGGPSGPGTRFEFDIAKASNL
jgi:type VI secretion system secreted protein Hcp